MKRISWMAMALATGIMGAAAPAAHAIKLENYQREFEEEGFKLHIEPKVVDFIIEEALRRQTGARGLDVIISKYLEEVAFETFGKSDEGEIILTLDTGGVSHIVKRRA